MYVSGLVATLVVVAVQVAHVTVVVGDSVSMAVSFGRAVLVGLGAEVAIPVRAGMIAPVLVVAGICTVACVLMLVSSGVKAGVSVDPVTAGSLMASISNRTRKSSVSVIAGDNMPNISTAAVMRTERVKAPVDSFINCHSPNEASPESWGVMKHSPCRQDFG